MWCSNRVTEYKHIFCHNSANSLHGRVDVQSFLHKLNHYCWFVYGVNRYCIYIYISKKSWYVYMFIMCIITCLYYTDWCHFFVLQSRLRTPKTHKRLPTQPRGFGHVSAAVPLLWHLLSPFLPRVSRRRTPQEEVFLGRLQSFESLPNITPAWNPKQPCLNGCLVKQPFFK